MTRDNPNIMICGTPGVGKTVHSEVLARVIGFTHLSMGQIVKERGYHDGWDAEYESFIVDPREAALGVKDELAKGGFIVDWHCCHGFAQCLIDLVVVLRTSLSNQYDRLNERNYRPGKIQENLDAECMEVVLTEAREEFPKEIIIELDSNTKVDMENNVKRIRIWIQHWKEQNNSIKN